MKNAPKEISEIILFQDNKITIGGNLLVTIGTMYVHFFPSVLHRKLIRKPLSQSVSQSVSQSINKSINQYLIN